MIIFAENFQIFNVMKQVLLLFTILLMTTSCENSDSSAKDAELVAKQWAEAYFNYDFEEASHHITEESSKWLQLMASNITEADVDVINSREEPTTVSVTDLQLDNDTSGQATLRVNNWVCTDSIGKPAHLVDEADFTVLMVRRDGKWLIKMASLPRNEKQSHDSAWDE